MGTEPRSTVPPAEHSSSRDERMVRMNEALVLGAVRQHELTEAAENLNAQLRAEISARQKAVRELTDKARLLDLSNDAIIAHGLDNKITSWNKGAERLYGWTCSEVIGKDMHSFLNTEFSRPRVEIEEQLRREGNFIGEAVQIARDGRRIASLCRWVLDREKDTILTSYTDITERKRAEEALRESEERYRTLFGSVPMAVYACDRNGVIQQYNPVATELWGREPLRGVECYCGSTRLWMPDGNLLPPDENPMVEVLRTGVPAFNVERVIERPDGSRAPALFNFAAVKNGAGEITGAITSFMDLTERKRLEQQFLRSQRMESIGRLAGGIAHDLNNALGPIITALDLLKMKFSDPDSQELIEIIDASAQRGADMVRQVLYFARGVEGRRVEVRVQDLVRDIEKIVNETFLRHIQIQTHVPQDLWPVVGDSTQLHQVLINLCINGRDAMQNGGVLIVSAEKHHIDAQGASFGLDSQAKPGPYVLLEVKDSGAGMSPQMMENIFDPFFTTKESGKGTGLGLSTSLAIVKSHGGFIRVASELGKGTTFQVFIPAQTNPSSPAPHSVAPEKPRGHGELILVVDDEASIRQITQSTLEAFGYRVVLASDGAEAVAIFKMRRAEIDLVLTDMTMPVMEGPEAIRILRSVNPKLRIIGASGLTSLSYAATLTSLGVKHILSKPYTAETLLKIIKLALEDPEREEETKPEPKAPE
jgi:PAS domain S-box-containing protein